MNLAHRNRSFGWWSLLCWLSLGMLLEGMQGFKVGWYLDVANDARRLQLTLAHAHGTLLALVNLAFAALATSAARPGATLARAGTCLRWAGWSMPVGFLLGGAFVTGPDPSAAIVLVPIGGLFLFAGVLLAVRAIDPTANAGAATPPPAPPRAAPKAKKG